MATIIRSATSFLDFYGRRSDGNRVKSLTPQFDGSPFAGFNCAAASEATRDITMNQGHPKPGDPWQPTGASIRGGTGDTLGGLMPTQTAAVSARHYGFSSDIRIVDWPTLSAKLWTRYSTTLLVRYAAISNAGHSASPGFMGNHSLDILGIRQWDTGLIEMLVSDPLADGRRLGIPDGVYWLNQNVLKQATGDLTLGDGTTIRSRNGSNHAYASFATVQYNPPPEPTQVMLKFGAHLIGAKRFRCLYNRTLIRTSPRRIPTNHARVIDAGETFDGYQRVNNSYGAWVGNKAGTRWVFRPGFVIARYL